MLVVVVMCVVVFVVRFLFLCEACFFLVMSGDDCLSIFVGC